MAAGDFSAATYPNVLVALTDIQSSAMLDMEIDAPVRPLETLARRQSVTLRDDAGNILTGGRCTTVNAYHTVVGSHLNVHERTDADTTLACNLATGPRLQAVAKQYTKNVNIKAAFQVNDDECDNASQFNEKVARGLAAAMADNRRRLQAGYLYPMLDGNAQANEANPAIFSEFTETGSGNRLRVDPANWDFQLALKMRLLAEQNRLGSFVALSGSNFFFDAELAKYRALNDDSRDENAIFMDVEMSWDTYDMDAVATVPTTYLVSTAVPAIWSSSWYPDTPLEKDPSTNYYIFRVADPVLQWNNNGQLLPFYHHVEHRYTCDSRNENDELKFAHTFNVTLIGGMHKSPDGFNWPLDTGTAKTQTRTGIMAIRNEVTP